MAFGGQLGRSSLGRFELAKIIEIGNIDAATVVGIAVISGTDFGPFTDSGTVIGIAIVSAIENHATPFQLVMTNGDLVMTDMNLVKVPL